MSNLNRPLAAPLARSLVVRASGSNASGGSDPPQALLLKTRAAAILYTRAGLPLAERSQ